MTNQKQLEDRIKSIYTFSYWKYSYEVEKISFEDNAELKECIVTVDIKTTEWKTISEYNEERKRNEEHIDRENPKVINTSHNTISLSVPIDDNNLVDIEGKDRVQINSARYRPLIKYYNKSARIGDLYINFENDDGRGEIEFSGECLPLPYLCSRLGIFKSIYPNLIEKEYLDLEIDALSMEDKDAYEEAFKKFQELEVPNRLLCKIEVITKGKNTFKSKKYDKEFMKFVLSVYLGREMSAESAMDLASNLSIPTPMEFLFMDSISGLCYELGLATRTIRLQVEHDFKKNATIKPTVCQNKINSYYRMQADEFRDVQVSKDSNALATLSQGHTIYFYEKNKDKVWEKMQLYNKYFVGVLDPTRTRDGNLNNINNELALCTEIKEDNVYITLIEKKTGKDVKLSYEDYIREKVLAVENYKDGKVIPNKNGNYTYCQYGDYIETNDISDVKYIRKAENLLSYATATIPFEDRQVSTRTLMASHFLDQSIPVIGAKPAIVHTKMNKWIYENSPYNIKADCDGVVTDMYDGYIKIATSEGKTKVLGRGKFFNTSMHTSNEYKFNVKVGDKVKKGQVLAYTNSFVDGEFTTQVPLYVCYGTYLGNEHEDGIILTESAAKKFGHTTYFEINYDFDNKYSYKFFKNAMSSKFYNANLDEWSLIKPGTKIKRGDTLFKLGRILLKHYRTGLASQVTGDENKKLFQEVFNVKVPYDVIEDGEVISATLYINDNENVYDENAPMLDWNDEKNVVPAYNYFKGREKAEYKRYKQFFNTKSETYDFGDGGKKPRYAMHLSVVVKYTNTMGMNRLGGKLSNFYASKGVNTFIIPDKYAPTDEFGNTIECFVSSLSTYSRTNPGQIDEVKLGLVGYEAWKRLIKDADKPNKKTEEFLNMLYPNGWDWEQLKSDGNKYGYIRIQVDEFDKYYTFELITKLLKTLGLGNGDSRIYLPEFGRKTEYPCTVGITSMMRLHFIQESKTSYTAEGSYSIVEDNDNIWYKNGERDGGQKVGAQEVWANIAHGLDDLMLNDAVKNDNKKAQVTAAFLMLGMKLNKR